MRAVWREELVAVAERLRDELPGDVGAAAPDVPLALVPTTDRRGFPGSIAPAPEPARRLPRRRRRAFRAHMRQVAAAVEAKPEEPPDPPAYVTMPPSEIPPAEGALLGAACAACGGRCCREGGERAYITPRTVRRWLAAHPGARPSDAVVAYAAYLPTTSVPRSCVYHTATGCALPRAMRSDVCNVFFCDGLNELRTTIAARASDGRPVRRVFLALVDSGTVRGGEVIGE